MNESVLICSTKYHGCGYVGKSFSFDTDGEHDYIRCPNCGEDHCFQLITENFASLTCGRNVERAATLLAEYNK